MLAREWCIVKTTLLWFSRRNCLGWLLALRLGIVSLVLCSTRERIPTADIITLIAMWATTSTLASTTICCRGFRRGPLWRTMGCCAERLMYLCMCVWTRNPWVPLQTLVALAAAPQLVQGAVLQAVGQVPRMVWLVASGERRWARRRPRLRALLPPRSGLRLGLGGSGKRMTGRPGRALRRRRRRQHRSRSHSHSRQHLRAKNPSGDRSRRVTSIVPSVCPGLGVTVLVRSAPNVLPTDAMVCARCILPSRANPAGMGVWMGLFLMRS